MENDVVKISRSSSNVSEIISRFAKVCKFKSFGVFPSTTTDQNLISNDPYDKPDETEIRVKKDKPSRKLQNFYGGEEISKLFDIVSVLKLAYVQFQQAHIPYDPDKIIEADNLVVSQFEAIRRIKRLYLKTKQHDAKTELASACLDHLRDEIEVIEKYLEKLKAEMKTKESGIHCLQRKLNDLVAENRTLEERITQNGVSVSSFEFTFKEASKSIHDFAKPLISLMKATGWNLDKAVDSIVPNVTYAKNSDKKYAFESYIARRMLHCADFDSCEVKELTKFEDPLEVLTAFPDSAFARYCGEKYLLVVHPLMEASFFGNLDMRDLVLLGKHPRTTFYRIFAKMAKWVWIFGSLSVSLDLKAKIFVVRRGTRFCNVYMESVKGNIEEEREQQVNLSVEFMIMPGFKIGNAVIKSQVYLSKTNV